MSGSGGDWEVMMLAEELEKREREKEREEIRRHHYPTSLRDLEEVSFIYLCSTKSETVLFIYFHCLYSSHYNNSQESDTPQREDSLDESSNIEDSNSSSTTHLLTQSHNEHSLRQRALETSFTVGQRRTTHSTDTARTNRIGSANETRSSGAISRQSRGLILRAASLDRDTTPEVSPRAKRFGSLKSSSTDSHKRL